MSLQIILFIIIHHSMLVYYLKRIKNVAPESDLGSIKVKIMRGVMISINILLGKKDL